jgi:hypothetical protein
VSCEILWALCFWMKISAWMCFVSMLHLFQYINRTIRSHCCSCFIVAATVKIVVYHVSDDNKRKWRVSEIKCDDPLNLSISISGGKEIKWDFHSSCEWTGIKPIANSYVLYNKRWGVKVSCVQQAHSLIIIEWVLKEGGKPVRLYQPVEPGYWRV